MLDYNHGAGPTAPRPAGGADVERLRTELIRRLPEVLGKLFPAGTIARGRFFVGDVLGSPGRSLEVVLGGEKAGLWTDRATGQGGDVIALIAAARQLDAEADFARVLDAVREVLGQPEPDKPPPRRAAAPPTPKAALDDLGPATAKWDYRDAAGALIAVVYRYDPPGGKKEFRPWDVRRRRPAPPDPRPLYNQPGLLASDTVVLVEGEKCAEALIEIEVCATTAMHGANAPVDKTDWSPLAGKVVLVWPDRDKPGWDYAWAAGRAALAAGAREAWLLTPPHGDADGWDAADAIAAGFDVADFLAHGPRHPMTAVEPKAADAGSPMEPTVDRTDDALGLEFTRLHASDWLHVAAWGKWLGWDGQRWRTDQTLQAYDLARRVCRDAALAADQGLDGRAEARVAVKLASTSTVLGVERLARADGRHAASPEDWDTDPWALNTPAGTVDLRTGATREHRREDRITQITSASCGVAKSPCAVWMRFLEDVTGGNAELVQYLQRMVGYSLTGCTSEHALFFLYGTGANGKSVFVNTVTALLGGYAMHAPIDTFMESRGDRHPTELAALRGARVVCSVETEQGRRWAESKIKALTAGDPIAARFMHRDFFVYVPQFKLVIAGNHKPSIRNVDEAMKRRLHLIPFTVTIPPAQRDPHLADQLLTERDAIMDWALQGCLRWQRIGLAPPSAVTTATDEYFEEEDTVGEFVREECQVAAQLRESIATLYQRWRERAEQRGEYAGTSRWLVQQLVGKGFPRIRLHGGVKALSGLALQRASAGSASAPRTPYADN